MMRSVVAARQRNSWQGWGENTNLRDNFFHLASASPSHVPPATSDGGGDGGGDGGAAAATPPAHRGVWSCAVTLPSLIPSARSRKNWVSGESSFIVATLRGCALKSRAFFFVRTWCAVVCEHDAGAGAGTNQ
jgi:hypothetical protein